MSPRYQFTAKLWRHDGNGAWHFVTVPVELSAQVRTMAGTMMNAFGTLRVTATIGAASWKTSLFFDTKRKAFLLPVKAEVRRKARVCHGDSAEVTIKIEL